MAVESKYNLIANIVIDYVGINGAEQPKRDRSVEIIASIFRQHDQNPVIYQYPFELICHVSSFLLNREITDFTCLSKSYLIARRDLDFAPSLVEKSRLLGLQLFSSSKECSENVLLVAAQKGKAGVMRGLVQMRLDISPEYLGWALEKVMDNHNFGAALDLVLYRQDMPAYWGEQLLWNQSASIPLRTELLRMPKYQLLYAVKFNNSKDVSNILSSFPGISPDWVGRALIEAATQGSREKVLVLLQKRRDISTDNIGSALLKAIENHQQRIALDLLNARSDFSDYHKNVALASASGLGEREIVAALIRMINNPNALVLGIVRAARNGHLEIVRDLVRTEQDFGVSAMGQALVESSENNHEVVVRYLISLNVHNAFDLERAITAADRNGHEAIADFLREQREQPVP